MEAREPQEKEKEVIFTKEQYFCPDCVRGNGVHKGPCSPASPRLGGNPVEMCPGCGVGLDTGRKPEWRLFQMFYRCGYKWRDLPKGWKYENVEVEKDGRKVKDWRWFSGKGSGPMEELEALGALQEQLKIKI